MASTIDKYKSYKCEIYFKDGNEPRKLTIVAKSNMQYFERTHTDEYMKEQLEVLKMEYADKDETILKIREDADR